METMRKVRMGVFYKFVNERALRTERSGNIYTVLTTSYFDDTRLVAKSVHGMGRPAFYLAE